MPKTNQIAFLASRQCADGSYTWHWSPSPKFRRLGWHSEKLGESATRKLPAHIASTAIARNEALAVWQDDASRAVARPAPRRDLSFGELVAMYMDGDTNPDWAALKPGTRTQYRSSLHALEAWAENGRTRARLIDADMVEMLADELCRGSAFRAANLLRMLKTLMGWASHRRRRLIPENPCADLAIPGTPSRTKRCTIEGLRFLTDYARKDDPQLAMALTISFFSTQRLNDVLALTRFNWRALDDMAGEDRRTLAGIDGRVMGFALKQAKTGALVDIPMPDAVRREVEGELARRIDAGTPSSYIIPWPNTDRAMPDWKQRRLFNQARDGAVQDAKMLGDEWVAKQLTGLTLRDLRRSGMCWMRDLGCTVPQIASISGHSIERTAKILDTYMPADSRVAASGMAHAIRRQRERDEHDSKETGQ